MVSKADLSHILASIAIAAVLICCVWVSCFKKRKRSDFETPRMNSLEKGAPKSQQQLISSLQAQAAVVEASKRRPSLHGFRRGGSTRPLFNWTDNPSLVTDAVESGWARFAFTLSPSVRPTSILGMCAAGDGANDALETEISWEIGHGSVDFMQKIRLNPGVRRSPNSYSNSNSHSLTLSVIRTALPLPGPVCAFPQEAYFEIIVLSCREEDEAESIKIREGERMKLIKESGEQRFSDSNISVAGGRDEARNVGGGGALVAVGLTVGGLLPMKIPGTYPGSIGFGSNGSVYHDGNKLVWESERAEWGMLTGKVIGCGYVPSQRKVFFTIDAEQVHAINCTTDEFATPLYPTLAANCDITLLVNNGQSPFKYAPANATRRASPCFLGSPSRPFSEDSKELFSMGRIDSQWQNSSGPRRSVYAGNNGNARAKEYDEDSEVDELFEIILEGNGTSSNLGR